MLDSVDLSNYGIQRVRLNASIALDDSESEIDPQNSNPRGAHSDTDEHELEKIITTFNERWFHGWKSTPEEQRVKFVSIAQSIKNHPDFKEKYFDNSDKHTKDIAFDKMFEQVIGKQRKTELDLYRLYSKDEGFKIAMQNTIKMILESQLKS